jgi:hypothetical protein
MEISVQIIVLHRLCLLFKQKIFKASYLTLFNISKLAINQTIRHNKGQ